MKKKIIVAIIIILILCLVYFKTVVFLSDLIVKTDSYNHYNFYFDINEYTTVDLENEYIHIKYECGGDMARPNADNNATVYVKDKNITLLNVFYDGGCETLKYKKINEYIIFWVNGEPEYWHEHNLRNNVLSKVFIYNINTAKIEELTYENNDSIIILDVLENNDQFILVGEKATKINWNGIWQESKLFVGEKYFDISIPHESDFVGNTVKKGNKYYITTDTGIYLLEEDIEKVFDYSNIKYAKIFEYNDYFIGFIEDKIYKFDNEFKVIECIDSDFELIDAIYISFYDIDIETNGAHLYSEYTGVLKYYIDFDSMKIKSYE